VRYPKLISGLHPDEERHLHNGCPIPARAVISEMSNSTELYAPWVATWMAKNASAATPVLDFRKPIVQNRDAARLNRSESDPHACPLPRIDDYPIGFQDCSIVRDAETDPRSADEQCRRLYKTPEEAHVLGVRGDLCSCIERG
jgi:hypothetical protein